MALYVGLQYPKTLGGFLIYSGFYFTDTKPHKANQKTPILAYHGEADPMIQWWIAEDSYKQMDNSKREFSVHTEKGLEHSIGEKGLVLMRKYFDKFIGREVKSKL